MSEQQSTSTNSSRILLAAAALIAVVGVGIVSFAVRGNDPAELVVSDNSTGPVGSELVAPATDPVATTVPVEVSETAAATTPDSAPISDDSTTTTPSPLPLVIPETLQGVWREVDGSPITADDCRIDLGFEENFGRVLTISESGFVFFESGGELIEVHDVDATRVEATFDTTVADTPTQDRITFDAPGDATVLIMSGDDRPGPTQYVRCPA